MDNPQATLAELGWLAGIIDGEGWLGVSLEKEHWRRFECNERQVSIKVEIKIVNCDPEIVIKTAQIMRKLDVNPYLRQPKSKDYKPNHNAIYEVSIKRMAPVQRILLAVRPYLTGAKAERADLILRFVELRQANPGIPNPSYADGAKGRRGPRTVRPYTTEELELATRCRALQSRKGASETTRANGEAVLQQMKDRAAR